MLPASPVDTSAFMRDAGRGYPEFDYAAAWREVRPMWDTLPEAIRDLYVRTCIEAREINQDTKLDLPWPRQGALRSAYASVDAATLHRAAEVIHALGHWCPLDDCTHADFALFNARATTGGYWKFARYADQSVRERDGKPWSGREPRPPTALETLCRSLPVTCTAREGAPDTDFEPNDWRATARGWTVTIRYQRRSLTTNFWQGSAHTKPPTAADVLSCLVSDAQGSAARSFEDWAAEYGYDADSRKAKRLFHQCEAMGRKVRTLLGEAFDRVAAASAEH